MAHMIGIESWLAGWRYGIVGNPLTPTSTVPFTYVEPPAFKQGHREGLEAYEAVLVKAMSEFGVMKCATVRCRHYVDVTITEQAEPYCDKCRELSR